MYCILQKKNTITSTTALHMTAFFGLEVETDILLENGHAVDCYNEQGSTPLSIAIEKGHEAIVWLLARKNPTLLMKYRLDKTILHLAVESGHESLAKSFLELDSDRRRDDRDAPNSLCKGVERAHNRAEVSLFDIQANLEKTDGGMTPLALAAQKGQHGIVKLLLKRGVRPDSEVTSHQRNGIERGATPLSIAARNGPQEIVKILLEHDARPDVKDSGGQTPLSHAAENGHVQVMQLLLTAGARINLAYRYGGSPLIWGVKGRQVAAVKLSLQSGANPNIHGYRSSALDIAVAHEMTDMVDLLLSHGASPNIHDRDLFHEVSSLIFERVGKETWTLLVKHVVRDDPKGVHDDMLLWAVGHGYIALVEVLLEQSANINIRDPQSGETPLSLAVMKRHYEVAAILIDKGANLLSKAALEGAKDVVRLLLERGANPKSRDSVGQAPLFYAMENGDEDDSYHEVDSPSRQLLKSLELEEHPGTAELPRPSKEIRLDFWAAAHGHLDPIEAPMEKDSSHPCNDDSRRTPFTLAIKNRQVAGIKHFLHCGLDPNFEDEAGYTPLSWAVHSGDEATIQLLLESGADHNTPIKEVSTEQETPRPHLLFFVERGYERVVKLLLQRGVDPNYEPCGSAESGPDSTDEWHNALTLAVMKGHFNVVNILLRRNIDNLLCHDALRLAMELTDTPLACLIMQKSIRTNWLLDAHGHELLFQEAFSGCVPVLKGLLNAGMKRELSAPSCRRPIEVTTIRRSSPTQIQKRANAYPGDTPLKFAAEEGHLEVVQVLLDNNTNPIAGSPLLGAIRNGHVRVAELLFRHGAQLDTENYGAVLLHVTVARGHLDAVRMVLDMGLDPKIGLDPELELDTWKQADPDKIKGMEKLDPERTYVGPGHLLFEAVARANVDIVQLLLTRV